jgi:hypothetical protein
MRQLWFKREEGHQDELDLAEKMILCETYEYDKALRHFCLLSALPHVSWIPEPALIWWINR